MRSTGSECRPSPGVKSCTFAGSVWVPACRSRQLGCGRSYDRFSMETFDLHGGLSRHLVGSGIEVGPGHHPLVESNRWLTVRYLDRWEPERNAELFPELEGATFPKPD